jgi:hypothetical protein
VGRPAGGVPGPFGTGREFCGPLTAATAARGGGRTAGGCSATGAFASVAGATWSAEGATEPALAKTRCGTTVANRRLAKFAFAACGGGAPFDCLTTVSMFLTLPALRLRM